MLAYISQKHPGLLPLYDGISKRIVPDGWHESGRYAKLLRQIISPIWTISCLMDVVNPENQ